MLKSGIKNWFCVAKPKKGLFVWQIIFSILEKMAFILVAMPSAKIISCVTVIDYGGAKLNICFVVILVFLYCLFASINSKLNSTQTKYIFLNCEKAGLEKIINANETNSTSATKQKITNIMTQNIKELASFCGELPSTLGHFVGLIFLLALLFSSNFTLGLIALGISLFCLLIYNLISFFEARATKFRNSALDQKDLLLDDIIEGRELASELNLAHELSNLFTSKSEDLIKTTNTATHLKNLRELWLYLLWNILVGLATFYMVYLLRLDKLTLSLFLLCLPYLNQALERTMNCYAIFFKVREAKSNAQRVETLLSLPAKDILTFGNNTSDNLKGDLVFTNVCLFSGSVPLLNHLSFGLRKGNIASFIFENAAAQVGFINLLKRQTKPTLGTITLDSINIYDFSKQVYSHNLATIASDPFFFANTIYENLKVATPSKKQIYTALKQLKIYEQIVELPQGVNTPISSGLSPFLLYELSICRAILTKSEILLFAGLPQSLSPPEQSKLTSIIESLAKTHTLLLATTFEPPLPHTHQITIKKDGKPTPVKTAN